MTRIEADVVVIGAGLSGLVAARDLVAAGKRVTVLEARDRVGGRTLSVPLAGQVVDLGGQWIGATHDRLRALCDQLRVDTFHQYGRGRKVLVRRGRRRTYRGLLPRIPVMDLVELGWKIATLEKLARSVPLERPLGAALAAEWDAQSLAAWLEQRVRTDGARDMLGLAAQMIFAVEPRELSFLYFLLYVHAGGGLTRLADTRGGAQERRIRGGAQQLCERLAAALPEPVALEQPVRAIAQDRRGVVVRTATGAKILAGRAILAAPPVLLDRIAFEPALPPMRARLQRSMPAGSVIKVVLAYDRPFWREAGFAGEAISVDGVVRAVFDDTSPDGSHAALVAFVVGDAARKLTGVRDDGVADFVATDLAVMFGERAREPIEVVSKNWIDDPWSAGCYVGVMPPGALTDVADALRTPCGRLHFAGTETAIHHVGYLEGAIEAGQRAAAEVLARAASDRQFAA